jgi:hypothetical protein
LGVDGAYGCGTVGESLAEAYSRQIIQREDTRTVSVTMFQK